MPSSPPADAGAAPPAAASSAFADIRERAVVRERTTSAFTAEDEEVPPLCAEAQGLSRAHWLVTFEHFFLVLIIIYALMMTFAEPMKAEDEGFNRVINTFETPFTILFTIELAVVLVMKGWCALLLLPPPLLLLLAHCAPSDSAAAGATSRAWATFWTRCWCCPAG